MPKQPVTFKCMQCNNYTITLTSVNYTLKECGFFNYNLFKAILRDVMGEEKFYCSLFFIIHLCNDPCCHRILSPRAGYLA